VPTEEAAAGGGGGDDSLAAGAIIGIVCGSFVALGAFVYATSNWLKTRTQVDDDDGSVSSMQT
jgi:hypothetical protein